MNFGIPNSYFNIIIIILKKRNRCAATFYRWIKSFLKVFFNKVTVRHLWVNIDCVSESFTGG